MHNVIYSESKPFFSTEEKKQWAEDEIRLRKQEALALQQETYGRLIKEKK